MILMQKEAKARTLVDLPSGDLITGITKTKRKITKLGLDKSSAKLLPKNSILISTRATIGRIAINQVELSTNQGFKNIIINDSLKVNEKYLAYVLTSKVEEMKSLASGGTFKEISKSSIARIKIPLPPLEVQEQIVEELNNCQKEIESYKAKIKKTEQKIKSKISEIWGN